MPTNEPQPERRINEVDLCTWYGDHDECPYQEVDEEGNLNRCTCGCHQDPEAFRGN